MDDPGHIDVKGKEWTVMFYFAADNSLSPLVVSQVKAIKDAGFQADTNVLVHFDPSEENEPTRIYHVNRARKRDLIIEGKRPTKVGDSNDSHVKNSVEDFIRLEEIELEATTGRIYSEAMKNASLNPDDVSAADALDNFIGYSIENYPANHYVLFLVGHGMIVGNDAFLPDDSPDTGVTLRKLNKILEKFIAPEPGSDTEKSPTTLELLALHSCSMSSIEVAYELKGKANYMMACQGTSYVGAWPYRQLLKKLFNVVEATKTYTNGNGGDPSLNGGPNPRQPVDVKELVKNLYRHSLYNSPDFALAGYSAELSLCSLQPDRVGALTTPLRDLVGLLKQGLQDAGSPVRELVQLAHLNSQSYWAESYTDLFDFCRCLSQACNRFKAIVPDAPGVVALLDKLKGASDAVIDGLETSENGVKETRAQRAARAKRLKGPVMLSDHLGSTYQYSHGLSIYFPWTEQLSLVPANGDAQKEAASEKNIRYGRGSKTKTAKVLVMENYKKYQFAVDLGDDSWASFLELYFAKTMRKGREEDDLRPEGEEPEFALASVSRSGETVRESEVAPISAAPFVDIVELADALASGALAGGEGKPSSTLEGGDGKASSTIGQPFVSTMIKNFQTHEDKSGRKRRVFSISPGAAQAFKPDRKRASGFKLGK